jgi:hypothetical protein
LTLGPRDPVKSFDVVQKPGPLPDHPFTPDTAPIELRAKARKIPAWQQDKFGMVGKLQPSPVRSDEPVETVSLIPMGAARLRISAFPVIGAGNTAHDWAKPSASPLVASHCWENDTLEAVIDGLTPKSSNDHSIPRFTWWDHQGTAEWIEWGFPQVRKVSAVEVYWFDDRPSGSCRPPQNWKLFYRVGEAWKPVEGASEFGAALDKFNRTTFNPVQANGLKIEVQLQPGVSAGILEWRALE